jgi:hypothetical protein
MPSAKHEGALELAGRNAAVTDNPARRCSTCLPRMTSWFSSVAHVELFVRKARDGKRDSQQLGRTRVAVRLQPLDIVKGDSRRYPWRYARRVFSMASKPNSSGLDERGLA